MHRLYDPSTPSDQSSQIQALLQNVQKQIGWQGTFELLDSPKEDTNLYFFAALTLQSLIVTSWSYLSADDIQALRLRLLGWIKRFSGSNVIVARKLSQALGSFVLRAVPDHWKGFIPDVVAAFGQDADGIMLSLDFLGLIPNEVNRAELVTTKKVQLEQELRDTTQQVLAVLKNILTTETSPSYLQRAALSCLQNWLLYGIPQDSITEFMPIVIAHISIEESHDAAIEVMTEVIGLNGLKSTTQKILFENVLTCLVSDWAGRVISQAITEGDFLDTTFGGLVRLATTFGEAFADTMAESVTSNPSVAAFLEQMLTMTSTPGTFALDEDISEGTLSFWYLYSEAICDSDLMSSEQAELERGKVHLRRLVSVLQQKCKWPDINWTKDGKDRFGAFRREAGDVLVNVYYVLRQDLLRDVLTYLDTTLESTDYVDIEATLFCLRCVAEAVPLGENIYMPLFFSDMVGRIPRTATLRTRRTTLYVIGSYSDWLKEHAEYLVPSMNFLVQCLSEKSLATSAATSLKDVCDPSRHYLVKHIETLIGMYVSLETMELEDRVKVLEAISYVIQALSPPELMISPLSRVLSSTVTQLRGNIDREGTLANLLLLEACSRGIQPPNNEPYIVEANTAEEVAALKGSEPAQQLATAIAEVSNGVALMYGDDEQVSTALTSFLRTSIRISLSHLLSPSFEALFELVASGYSQRRFPCWLDLGAQLIVVAEQQHAAIAALTGHVTLESRAFSNLAEMERYPDTVHSLFNYYERVAVKSRRSLVQNEQEIMQLAVRGISMQERFSMKAAVNFLVAVMDENTQGYVKGILEAALRGITGQVPRSLLPMLSELLYRMVKRYPAEMPYILRQEMGNMDLGHASAASAQRFVEAVSGARSLTRVKEAVNAFAAAARGSFA